MPYPFISPSSVPVLAFSDDFDRTDSDTVDNGWVEVDGDWDILSNQLVRHSVGASGTDRCLRPTGEEITDGWAECDVFASAIVIGPCIRFNASTDNGYVMYQSGASLLLVEISSGSKTTIASQSDTQGNQTYRIEADGTTIKAFVDTVEELSASDSTHSSGVCGVYCGSATNVRGVDNFAMSGVLA